VYKVKAARRRLVYVEAMTGFKPDKGFEGFAIRCVEKHSRSPYKRTDPYVVLRAA